MSKLTNSIREQMARKLVQYRYADEAKELVRLNRTLADRVYADVYTPEITSAIETIRKTFPCYFEPTPSVTVNADGYHVSIGGRMSSRWVTFEQAVHEGYHAATSYRSAPTINNPKLATEVKEFVVRLQGFDDVCHTAYMEALSVLNTMTTGKKLAQAWPEAMDVIGDLIPEGERTMPVVQVSSINAKFKLPPKK